MIKMEEDIGEGRGEEAATGRALRRRLDEGGAAVQDETRLLRAHAEAQALAIQGMEQTRVIGEQLVQAKSRIRFPELHQARHWVFTLNNPTAEETVGSFLSESENIEYFVFGRETGEEGTPHFQGYLQLIKKQTLKWIKKHIHKTAHWEVMRCTPKQASDYCKKDGDFIEVGELPETAAAAGGAGNKKRWVEANEKRLVLSKDAQDDAEAVRLYRLAAAQGDADAQYNLGAMFEKGQGVAKDDAEAVRLYRIAAAQGHARAQCKLGFMFAKGRGVAKDDTEAVRLYRLAAAQGNAGAQFNLGLMFEFGQGVAKDHAEAVRLYRLAAEQGDADAQGYLGFMFDFGRCVAKDDAEAVRLYRLAAAQGHARAQFKLGVMFEDGRGVAKDDAEAIQLYRLAAAQGQANATAALNRLRA